MKRATPRPWPPVLVIALGSVLVLAGCRSAAPTVAPVSTGAPAGSPIADSGLGDALRDAVKVNRIVTDLASLESIAREHDGNRAVGTSGYDASASFVADELGRAGLTAVLQPVEVHAFRQDAPSALAIDAAAGVPPFEDLRDFKAMLFSASGAVTARVFALGYDRTATPGARNGLGCDASDWAAIPAGVIVLLQPATCRRHDVVVRAQAAGALAVITAYAEWPRDGVLRPTLLVPDDIRIPVIGTTKAVGDALADAAAAGREVHVEVHATVGARTSMNVIAETVGGDPTHVLMLGAHLDSVVDGPGINDNGSGAMAVLEIARELAAIGAADTGGRPAWKVRMAFWAGEEIGLAGSAVYLGGLDPTAARSIQAYLNFDMLGSPNGVRFVYDPAGSSRPLPGAVIAGLFEQAFAADGLRSLRYDVGGASDHAPFDQSQITVGGLFSGANERKTAEQASLFGGVAETADDACYHLACDSTDNIDGTLLAQMTRAAAWVTGALASGTVQLPAQ